ncbi:ATP-binding protein [Streptomyces kasugaensis]|uniref:ATP-binding protein n=1 Tax=Streptomyces kasugaensis TaxID=1946 RepID=A0A4Q9HPS9_STRKA|nr:ATP-binding protein [Streptomyces kasugaensis]TBO56903.1 ATP-binding protein [Streptomyces kasugaensis]
MDPNTHRGPDENGEQGHPAEPPASASGDPQTGTGGLARVVQLVSGSYLVTVNPVDGSEIEPCPPGEHPAAPGRLGPSERAAAAPVPPEAPGFAGHALDLEERAEDIEHLVQLLSRGRSVRVTGPAGSGRTRLLDAVADACADLAPDGVVRLSGYHRTATDVLYTLFAAVHEATQYRPERPELLRLLSGIGAIVVLDDLEFGGDALDELLDATPECAFLLAATPDIAAPGPDAHLEEVTLGGIGLGGCVRMLEHAVDRPLTDDEAAWAADLWYASEGLPLRFVQAAALLRQREDLLAGPGALDDGYGLFPDRPRDDASDEAGEAAADAATSLPAPDEAAPRLAAGLGAAARETLRFAVALGGELPSAAQLPALTQDPLAEAALGELLGCGLITQAGTRYRLAAAVQEQLTAAGYAAGAAGRAHTAAQHYAWWAGHPSVTPEQVAAESDAVLAAMAVLTGSRESGHTSAAVLLARTAAPAFAAALHWSAWERSLRHGQEAARLAGEVAQEAYFHHELGVLALCTGSLDRARAELEASIGLRGVLSDRDGAVAGRRALALVADRTRFARTVGMPQLAATPTAAGARPGTAAPSPDDVPTTLVPVVEQTVPTAVAHGAVVSANASGAAAGKGAGKGAAARPAGKRGIFGGARRNLVAAGAGVLLAAVLGTVVTLGATSGGGDTDSGQVTSEQSTAPDGDGQDGSPDQPATGQDRSPSGTGADPSGTPEGKHSPSPSTGSPDATSTPTDPGDRPTDPTTGPTSSAGSPSTGTDKPPSHKPSGKPSDPSPTTDKPTDDPTTPTPSDDPTDKPTSENPSHTAVGPMGGASGSGSPATSGGPSASGHGADGTPAG